MREIKFRIWSIAEEQRLFTDTSPWLFFFMVKSKMDGSGTTPFPGRTPLAQQFNFYTKIFAGAAACLHTPSLVIPRGRKNATSIRSTLSVLR